MNTRVSRPSRRLAALALLLAGCSSSADRTADGTAGTGDGAQSDPVSAVLVEFFDEQLTFSPGEEKSVGVRVSPAGRHTVRFSLLGDSQDAFLNHSEVVTSEEGTAVVKVTAPSMPATFLIRASVGGTASAEIAASTGEALTTFEVVPQYAWTRSVNEWVATVQTGADCASLMGIPPPDGTLKGTAPAPGHPLVLRVPVGVPLAVTIRAGHFAGGCADVERAIADEINRVVIPVADRPLQMDQVSLRVSLGIEDSFDSNWQALMESATANLVAAMMGNADSDATAILNAMSDEAGTEAFQQARTTKNWDALLADQLLSQASGTLPSTVRQWLLDGAERLVGTDTMIGALVSDPATPGRAVLVLSSIADISPDAAGFAATNTVSWEADTNDKVRIGADLSWLPSRLLTALATDTAQRLTGASTVPEALAELVDCPAVGQTLVGQSTEVYAGCATDCLSALCAGATELIWNRAQAALVVEAPFEINAAGTAAIDDEARPIGFDGGWVGAAKLHPDLTEVRLEGPARAQPIEASPSRSVD